MILKFNYNLDLIELVRKNEISNLLNQEYLEELLIPYLGITNEDDYLTWPKKLYPFFGNGLYCWQYPNQFSRYLTKLAEYKINSYVEIGVRHGGTFILTNEYLSGIGNELKLSIAVDLEPPSQLMNSYLDINKKARYLHMSSQTEEFRKKLHSEMDQIDLILIDGEHTYDAVMRDFEIVRDIANMVVLHDISSICAEVNQAWNYLLKNYSDSHHFFPFEEQYEEVIDRYLEQGFIQERKELLGIGLMVKKTFLPSNQEKINDLKSANISNQNKSDFFNLLGTINNKKNNSGEAIKYFTKSLEFNPKNLINIKNIAESLEKLGDIKTSKAYLDKYYFLSK